jgi:hypothetical protein
LAVTPVELLERLRAFDSLSPAQGFKSFSDLLGYLSFPKRQELISFFHQTKGFPDDFAGRVVTAASNLSVNKLLQFRRQVNIHGESFPNPER